jgi:hypothetical protein
MHLRGKVGHHYTSGYLGMRKLGATPHEIAAQLGAAVRELRRKR